jgi:hypothetical protein
MMEERFTLNGEYLGVKDLHTHLIELRKPEVRRLTGGALFQYLFAQDSHHFGILPWYTQGQRNSHHEIPLAVDSPLKLIGNLDQKGLITLLFRAQRLPITPEERELYRQQYHRFSHYFSVYLPFGEFLLDQMTQQMLIDAELSKGEFSIVADLKNL